MMKLPKELEDLILDAPNKPEEAKDEPVKKNRAQRRAESRPIKAGGNRKNTKGRKKQFVDVMEKVQTRFGVINAPTGYVKSIDHQPVAVKKYENRIKLQQAVNKKKHPLKEEPNEDNIPVGKEETTDTGTPNNGGIPL